jgi:hypothetical protein
MLLMPQTPADLAIYVVATQTALFAWFVKQIVKDQRELSRALENHLTDVAKILQQISDRLARLDEKVS